MVVTGKDGNQWQATAGLSARKIPVAAGDYPNLICVYAYYRRRCRHEKGALLCVRELPGDQLARAATIPLRLVTWLAAYIQPDANFWLYRQTLKRTKSLQVLIGKSAVDNDRLSLEHGRADEVQPVCKQAALSEAASQRRRHLEHHSCQASHQRSESKQDFILVAGQGSTDIP